MSGVVGGKGQRGQVGSIGMSCVGGTVSARGMASIGGHIRRARMGSVIGVVGVRGVVRTGGVIGIAGMGGVGRRAADIDAVAAAQSALGHRARGQVAGVQVGQTGTITAEGAVDGVVGEGQGLSVAAVVLELQVIVAGVEPDVTRSKRIVGGVGGEAGDVQTGKVGVALHGLFFAG